MKFPTAYTNRPKELIGEINNGEKMVITAGYMTVKQRVNQMKIAGGRIEAFRASQFDADAGVDPNEILRNEMRGLDLLDGMQKTKQIENFIERKREEIKTRTKREEDRAAAEAENEEFRKDFKAFLRQERPEKKIKIDEVKTSQETPKEI